MIHPCYPKILPIESMPDSRTLHSEYMGYRSRVIQMRHLMKEYGRKLERPKGTMPCRQRINICYEARCINTWDCEAFERGKKR